ncbi:MAG TPA: shikimate kinase, partial [Nocardioidaceae bacterium]|nr:shikimate kinase [Nocardioidaceae bacterium]
LAERLGVALRDTDADVEESAGATIPDLFVDHGEAYFRTLERQAVATALTEHDGVLSLGGGAVLDPDTREALRGHRVVFLDVGLAEAVRRVGLGVSRPLLLGNVRAQLKALLDQRRPMYEAVAWRTVDTDGQTPEQIVDDIASALTREDAAS